MKIDFKSFDINQLLPKTKFEQKTIAFVEEWFSSSKEVEVQTSGSTGIPKVLKVNKDKMLNSAKMTCDFLDLHRGDTALLCLPLEYISGKMMVVRSLERGLTLTIADPSLRPLENLKKRIGFCAMTPLQVENSLHAISKVQKLIIGGAGVSESLKKKLHEVLSSEKNTGEEELTIIYETYGMSETLSHIALKQLYPVEQDYFTLFDGIEVKLDSRGALLINAPKVSDELIQTNDLVELIAKDKFRFLGRTDNVINSGGAKIRPEELESLVKRQVPREVVFVGVKDDVLGEKLVLVVEGEESSEIRAQIEHTPFEKNFHRPKAVLFAQKIPRTSNGKISRPLLKKWLEEQVK
ncbi:AMP-binding protein [Chryseobacterium sp. A301]